MFTYEVSVTNQCNLDCYFCFASNKKEIGYLSLENFIKGYELTKQLKDKNEEIFIKMYGGEPLLYTDAVISYLEYLTLKCKIDNFYIALITNGTLITKKLVDKIVEFRKKGLRIFFNISMEGCKETHDQIRYFKTNRKGSFDIIIKNIKYLNKIFGYKASVQSVLSPNLLANIDEYINFIDEYSNLAVFNIVPMFDETFRSVDLKILQNMNKLFDYYISSYKQGKCSHIGLFQSLRSLCGGFNLIDKTYCTAGYKQLSILPNGDLYPCVNFYHRGKIEYKYGNVNDATIDDYNKYREYYKNSIKHSTKCIWCQISDKFGCLGQCIANMTDNNRELMPWVCAYNKTFGLNSMRLKEELKNNEYFLKEVNNYDTYKIPEFHKEFVQFIKGDKI